MCGFHLFVWRCDLSIVYYWHTSHTMMDAYPSGIVSQNELFVHYLAFSHILAQQLKSHQYIWHTFSWVVGQKGTKVHKTIKVTFISVGRFATDSFDELGQTCWVDTKKGLWPPCCCSNKWPQTAWAVLIYTISMVYLQCYNQFLLPKYLKMVTIITALLRASFPSHLPALPGVAINLLEQYLYNQSHKNFAIYKVTFLTRHTCR